MIVIFKLKNKKQIIKIIKKCLNKEQYNYSIKYIYKIYLIKNNKYLNIKNYKI